MSMDQVHIDGDDNCDEAVQQNVGKQSSSHLIVDSIYVSPDSPKNIILVCKSENNEKNNLTRALMKSKLAKYGQWISGGYRYRLIPLKILNQVVDEEEKQRKKTKGSSTFSEVMLTSVSSDPLLTVGNVILRLSYSHKTKRVTFSMADISPRDLKAKNKGEKTKVH